MVTSRQGVYITAVVTIMKRNATITLTLCHDCAQVIREDKTQTIRRVDKGQRIKEPCDICRRKGYEYEVKDNENRSEGI